MKILIVGAGGREHALGWKLKQSPLVSEIIAAPGNPGLAELGAAWRSRWMVRELATLAAREQVGLVVIGPKRRRWRAGRCAQTLAFPLWAEPGGGGAGRPKAFMKVSASAMACPPPIQSVRRRDPRRASR